MHYMHTICPNCGKCPVCGRQKWQPTPYYPQPAYPQPYYPTWTQPVFPTYTVTVDSNRTHNNV